MALRIEYRFDGEPKTIRFANDKYHDHYEALAAAEGIDLTQFLAMEKQIASLTRDKKALRDYRENEFERFGFSDIQVIRE
ncbi:DUF2960 domain-containing protein [Pseudaeromonas sharmana]|uniref:DUF2960 domain-containing protein n=1 Tax=Pseudaeromonas sharmana TaxID=328412 RepID=A0ABV8CIB9_9GAMM